MTLETAGARFERRDDIGFIIIDNPPVNALSPQVRAGIAQGVEQGVADPGIVALVLIGAGRTFIAGADIRRLATNVPLVNSYAALSGCPKVIVAAINGHALGGGLEHALTCDFRIAVEGANLGLPEVNLGLIPGSGGTQRLPRLVGLAAALDLVVSGRHVSAAEAKSLGLIDELIPAGADLYKAAAATARTLARAPKPPQRQDPLDRDPELFDSYRKQVAKRYPGQKARALAVDAVEAASTMPLSDGLAFERRLFETLRGSPEQKALSYAFLAERAAVKPPTASSEIRVIDQVAIVGAGTMGRGIAMALADAGIAARITDANPDALAAALLKIEADYEAGVRRGRLDGDAAARRLALIRPASGFDGFADCEAVIEAAVENLEVKRQIFAELDAIMKPGALLLTNTSALSLDDIASATGRPQDVAGAHFFSPANVMKLLEVVRGAATSDGTLASTMELGRRLGKIAVPCGNCDGFVANRSRSPMIAECNLLVEEGASPYDIDRIALDFGYPMGPFATNDLSGLDIAYATRKRRAASDPGFRTLPIPDHLVETGRLGQKTGAGWYRYEAGARTPLEDPALEPILAEIRSKLGAPTRAFQPDEILQRFLLASVNEACRIIEERIVTRAPDIDVMWLAGFNFPRARGGLLFWADTIGPTQVLERVQAWHRQHGERWRPARLLSRLARENISFVEAHRALAN